LTPNNNNIIKTTTTMLGYQNWTWISPILDTPAITKKKMLLLFFLNLREERNKMQVANTVISEE